METVIEVTETEIEAVAGEEAGGEEEGVVEVVGEAGGEETEVEEEEGLVVIGVAEEVA